MGKDQWFAAKGRPFSAGLCPSGKMIVPDGRNRGGSGGSEVAEALSVKTAKGGTNAEIQANLIAKLKQIANSLKNGKLP